MNSNLSKNEQLIRSGMYRRIKDAFNNSGVYISDKYIILIAEYFYALNSISPESGFFVDINRAIQVLPQVLKSIKEDRIGVYGITKDNTITMNSLLSDEANKLYFFHELTHAIQTRMKNGHEECSLYNGKTGMFLTEGSTQFLAEILYNISNGGNIKYRQQPNSVRGLPNHTPYSALSEYQLNGNIIMMMSYALRLPLNQFLALGYRSDGRDLLGGLFNAYSKFGGDFEEFMFDLEKIYAIDKLYISGYADKMKQEKPSNIILSPSVQFPGNLKIENNLINKVERKLINMFIYGNEKEYVMSKYKEFEKYITSSELRQYLQTEVYNRMYEQQQGYGFA